MALVKCSECNTQVSDKADNCPNCGVKIQTKKIGCLSIIGYSFLALFAVSFIVGLFQSSTPSQNSEEESSNSAIVKPKVIGSQWLYSQVPDKMGKGEALHALVLSENTVNFAFPYAGEQKASLNLRTHPRHGKDVILSIDKGQFLCRSYNECTVLIRFDDGEPKKFLGLGASDNSSTTVFIKNYPKFLENMLKAKLIRISTEVYQEGSPIFEFDVEGFDQKKYFSKS